MAGVLESRKFKNRLALIFGGVQLLVFLCGSLLILSSSLTFSGQVHQQLATSRLQGMPGDHLKPSYFRVGLGPHPSVSGLTVDRAVYGFLSSVCSNTSTITLWCLTGRQLRWPRSSFVARVERIARSDDQQQLLSMTRGALSLICKVTNLVSTGIAMFDWILAPALLSEWGRSCFAHTTVIAVCAINQLSTFFTSSVAMGLSAVGIMGTFALVLLYRLLTPIGLRLKHYTVSQHLGHCLLKYSGLGFFLRVSNILAGLFLDSIIFIFSTICSEQFLLHSCIRLAEPTSFTSPITSFSFKLLVLVSSVLGGLALRLCLGRVLEGSPFGRHALELPSTALVVRPACNNVKSTVGSDEHPGQAGCGKLQKIPARTSALLFWIIFFGDLVVKIPSTFGCPLLVETVYWAVENKQYTELRQLNPFWRPPLVVVPLKVHCVLGTSEESTGADAFLSDDGSLHTHPSHDLKQDQPVTLRNVFVKLHTGKTICFPISTDQTVQGLKEVIERKGGLPSQTVQVLRMGPVILQDDWILGERGFEEGTCLEQSLPLFGGAPQSVLDSDDEPLAARSKANVGRISKPGPPTKKQKTTNKQQAVQPKSKPLAKPTAQKDGSKSSAPSKGNDKEPDGQPPATRSRPQVESQEEARSRGTGPEPPFRRELGRGQYRVSNDRSAPPVTPPAINSAGAKIFNPEYADSPGYFTNINGVPVPLPNLEAFLCGDSADDEGLDDCDDDEHVTGGRLTAERRNAINQKRQTSRPNNTRRFYYPRLKHFVTWCTEYGRCMPIPFADRAAAFLAWRTRNKIGRAEKVEFSSLQIESDATFDTNLAALTDAKKRLEDNFNWDLGTRLCDYGMIKNIGENVRADAERHRVESREDPQLNTGADALTREDFKKCCDFLAEKPRDAAALRYGSMMKVARQAIFKGDDQRGVRIADMFFHNIPLKAVGPDPCTCLCIISRTGKTNIHHKVEYGFMFRGEDPTVCAIGGLARYFYHRFAVLGEQPLKMVTPEGTQNVDWIDRLTWPSHHPSRTQQLSPDAHSAYVKEVFKQNEVICSKVLHAFRPSAALEAAVHGISFENIMRAGRWHYSQNEALAMSYLSSICSDVGLVLAGFSKDASCHVQPRSCLNIERDFPALLSLARKHIWPWVEVEEEKIRQHNVRCGPQDRWVAAANVCFMLKRMRIIVLEDAVFLTDLAPFDPIRGDPIFKSPEFLDFAVKLREAAVVHKRGVEAMHPSNTGVIVGQLGNALERVLTRLRGSHSTMMHGLRRLFECFQNSENPPSAEEVASIAQDHLNEDLNFSPFKTADLNRPEREGQPEPRNLFPDSDPSLVEQHRLELSSTISKLVDAQQKALDLFELSEKQKASTDLLEKAKAETTSQRARMQASVAETLAKKVDLLECSKPLPSSTTTPSSAIPSNQPPPNSHPISHPQSHSADIHTSQASGSFLNTTRLPGASLETSSLRPESVNERGPPVEGGAADPQPAEPERETTRVPAKRRGGLQDWETYLLPSNVTVSDIWKMFQESGPNEKPSILELMVKSGTQNMWYHQAETKEGQNNRKHQWHEKYKPILWEIIADTTDPKKRMTATASIKRLQDLEMQKNYTTPALGKYLNGIYTEAGKTIKASRNKKDVERAVAVQARKTRALDWIDNRISSGR